jgi:hypothetical protein
VQASNEIPDSTLKRKGVIEARVHVVHCLTKDVPLSGRIFSALLHQNRPLIGGVFLVDNFSIKVVVDFHFGKIPGTVKIENHFVFFARIQRRYLILNNKL